MNAVELAMMDHVNGRMQGPTTITVEDLERMRRLNALGAAALSGGERPTELPQLAFACAESLFGANWRRLAREAEYTLQAFLQGLPRS